MVHGTLTSNIMISTSAFVLLEAGCQWVEPSGSSGQEHVPV